MHKIEQYGFAPRRMVYLPFGLETRQLSRPRPGPSSTALRIGYLGQFAPHKGVHLLLAAFQRLIRQPGSCELVLYGSLSNQSAYERGLLKIAQNDAAITFAGSYPNSKVGEVLNDLDVVVVPSLWYENRPTVIVEAHAAGIPVVAARLGGMAELIQHGENGLLFEPGSVASLTEQLQRLLDEPALLSQLRSGIRPVPTIDEETAALVSLYEQLASAPEPARSITPAQA